MNAQMWNQMMINDYSNGNVSLYKIPAKVIEFQTDEWAFLPYQWVPDNITNKIWIKNVLAVWKKSFTLSCNWHRHVPPCYIGPNDLDI